MTTQITALLIIVLFCIILSILIFSGNKKLRLKVKSVESKDIFDVVKKENSNGSDFLDWFYYNEKGNEIKDENLKKMIFEAFGNEDWYGDYEFYTKAVSNSKSIKKEEVI